MLGALRVMRPPGEWSPLDLPSLVGWYDASDTATITDSGGEVSQWDDKANGYHLTQSTAGLKPTTGTRTINGLNVLDFDGSDNLRRTTTPSTTVPFMVYVVFFADSAAGCIFDGIYGPADKVRLYYSGSTWHIYNGSNPLSSGDGSSGAVHQWSLLFNSGNAAQIWKDGSSLATSSIVGSYGFGGINVGRDANDSNAFNGAIAELIISDSSDDQALVESYLKAKWGTP